MTKKQHTPPNVGVLFHKLSANALLCALVDDVTSNHALEIVIFSTVQCPAPIPVRNAISLLVVMELMVGGSVHMIVQINNMQENIFR